MVDHLAVHPVRAATLGPVGFPSLEGRTEGRTPHPANKKQHYNRITSHSLSNGIYKTGVQHVTVVICLSSVWSL